MPTLEAHLQDKLGRRRANRLSGFTAEPAALFAAASLLGAEAEECRAELARLEAAAEDLLTGGVDLERLEQLVARMAAFGQQFACAHAEVDSRVRGLQAGWTGDAAAAQAETHRRWSVGAGEMHEALVQLRSAAATAHGNYDAAMRANLLTWAR